MKKKHTRQATKIREIETNTDYNGERSPYWEFIAAKRFTDDGELREHPLANPDVLSEEASMFHQPSTEEAELKAEIIREMIAELSPQQQKIIRLCGIEGYTLRKAADELHLKLATVQSLLNRARAKILRRYEQRRNLD